MNQDVITLAARDLGYEVVSSEQRSVVQAFLDGHDVFFCLPTGSGKSLCYWILPRVFDMLRGLDSYSIVVVVSPLKALMREQVEALKGRWSRAVCVGGRFVRRASKRRNTRRSLSIPFF